MSKNIVRVTNKIREAKKECKAINRDLLKRKIKREAYITPVSYRYVKSLTRKGYPVAKKNWAIAVRRKLKRR